MATAVANKVFEAVEALENAAVDSLLQRKIAQLANAQAVLPTTHTTPPGATVGSPLIKLLIDNHENFLKTDGIAHVLYAPTSTGKTTALKYFVMVLLKKLGAPALMVSSTMSAGSLYLDTRASALQVRDGNSTDSWLAALVTALMPTPGLQLQHAPVLIFDEFNSLGPNNQNIHFAESFTRYIFEKGFILIFVTQNDIVAKELCKINRWQKIGPLPHATAPDRTTVCKEDPPPLDYNWKSMGWTQRQLTQLILNRNRFKSKFEGEVTDRGRLLWLEGITTPTAAIGEAFRQLKRIEHAEAYEISPDFLLEDTDDD